MSLEQQIDTAFTYQRPSQDGVNRITYLRGKLKDVAETIERLCPASRERSIALTKLEEVMMWANAAIVREDKDG
ncbi:MAG: hypothetical protein AAGF92_24410 [Myxococcota bacterium]